MNGSICLLERNDTISSRLIVVENRRESSVRNCTSIKEIKTHLTKQQVKKVINSWWLHYLVRCAHIFIRFSCAGSRATFSMRQLFPAATTWVTPKLRLINSREMTAPVPASCANDGGKVYIRGHMRQRKNNRTRFPARNMSEIVKIDITLLIL